MRKIIIFSLVILGSVALQAQNFKFVWNYHTTDASRTGVKYAELDNIKGAMGYIKDYQYFAPNGRVFNRNSSTYKVAKLMIEAQSKMKDVKTVIAYSPREMTKHYPESELSNWFVDNMMKICEEKTGEKVDVGIANFGGIRQSMPEGNVYKQDILSMFPFKNSLVYVKLKGEDLLNILEYMASAGFQALGGVKVVAEDGQLLSATIDNKPIDRDKLYGVATISFLLNGGDGLYIGKNALEIKETKGYLYDHVLELVHKLTKEHKAIEYKRDGRVKIISKNGEIKDVAI